MLEPVDLVAHALLVLLELRPCDLVFVVLQLTVFSLNVFILIRLEKLGLGSLVLLVLVLKVTQLTVKFVECVLGVLEDLVGLRDLGDCLRDALVLVADQLVDALASLVVVLILSV